VKNRFVSPHLNNIMVNPAVTGGSGRMMAGISMWRTDHEMAEAAAHRQTPE